MKLPEGARVRTTHHRFEERFAKAAMLDGSLANNALYALRPNGQFKGLSAAIREAGMGPSSRGGATMVELQLPDGRVFDGVSVCCFKDNFHKKLGRQIALGRALKALQRAEELGLPMLGARRPAR